MINTKAKAVSAPTPGCVRKRRASGHFSTSCSIACVSSLMVGFNRSSSCSRSSRRRLAQGANRKASNCCRPFSRHSFFLQRKPSFRATACSWFMMRVRACTIRCRCHSSCRRSRFSPLGTQILGKRFSISNCRICCASCRSVFCLRSRFLAISVASPIHNSKFTSARSRSNQRACPLASHSHSYLLALGCEVTIKLFFSHCALIVALRNLPSRYLQTHLLETRVIIASYNAHGPAPFCPSLHGWFWHHQVYSGLGAGNVMESITRFDP